MWQNINNYLSKGYVEFFYYSCNFSVHLKLFFKKVNNVSQVKNVNLKI